MNAQISQPPLFDDGKACRFVENVSTILNSGAIASMMSIGHRLGLFKTLSGMTAATSTEIAEMAGLAERYVREWLAVMVTGRLLEFDHENATYRLPPEHAACLVEGAPFGNLAVYGQMVALVGKVEDRLLQVFRTGDGLSYSDYPCFHQIMSEDSGQTVVAVLEETISTLVPELVHRLEGGIDVLDAGCGAGLAVIRLAELYPHSRFTGIDLCADAIEMARSTAVDHGLTNVEFHAQDLAVFDADSCYDLITSFDAVHDVKDPQRLLRAIFRAIRPGGVHLMQDIGGSARLENNLDFPFAPFLYAISCCHCTPVSLAQGGAGLGTMWGWETADAMLHEAGFEKRARSIQPHDPMNVWFVSTKNAA